MEVQLKNRLEYEANYTRLSEAFISIIAKENR